MGDGNVWGQWSWLSSHVHSILLHPDPDSQLPPKHKQGPDDTYKKLRDFADFALSL